MSKPAVIRACVVTASRSEYGLLRWVIKDLVDDPRFAMDLVVTGSHFSSRHDVSLGEIEGDGVPIALQIPVGADVVKPSQMAATSAAILAGLTGYLEERRPDIVIVLGDRWELLAIAEACTLAMVPIGHFNGGEITEGALDDNVRHAVTKLAQLHFVANEDHAGRVRQLGEEGWRICVCGSPGIDNFRRLPLLSKDELGRELKLDMAKPVAAVTFHPPTRTLATLDTQIDALVAALRAARRVFGLQYVVTAPAMDPGADRIEAALRSFASEDDGAVYVASLGTRRYLSLLKSARVMIGNSSSAFHEAPVAGLVAVNVGDRQQGRVGGGNVISVGVSADEIVKGIRTALSGEVKGPFLCPYGDGSASAIAREFISLAFARRSEAEIMRKRFVDAAPLHELAVKSV